MWREHYSPKYLSFILCLFLFTFFSEEAEGEFFVRRSSPNVVIVAQGQALQLDIILNGTDEQMPMLVFLDWNFRVYHSNFVKRLLSVTWDRGHVVSEKFYDERTSILDSASLLLIDTTLEDSGTYWCNVLSLPSQHYPVLYFNVTVEGKPTAEIDCPEQMNITEGKNFSCWCNARGGNLTVRSYWQMIGAPPYLNGTRRNTSVELSLQNVKRHMAGTYVCKAQLFSLVDEKILTLSVLYGPTIRSFRGKVLKDNSLKMTCLAKGLPRPTYMITISNGLSLAADIDGVVMINDYKSIINASYTCIASNSVGHDQWHLNGILTISKDETIINRKSFLQDNVWYIIGGSAIAGILFGFLLLRICQTVVCKKSRRHEQNEQDLPVYVDPSTLPMSQGRKNDPLTYIDVHALPKISQGGVNENLPVYIDPDTVVSSRQRCREAKDENQALRVVQAKEPPEDDGRVYQLPDDEKENEGGEIDDNRTEEDVQEIPKPVTTNNSSPDTHRKPRANTEPMMGYQDLDSSDEVEEHFYHSLHSASIGQLYYVNERVKDTD